MNKEINSKVAQTVSKVAVSMAMHITKAPNQSCPIFLGEPESDLALVSKDYRDLHDFINNNHI